MQREGILHLSNTASTWETCIQIWTTCTCLFLDVNTTPACRMRCHVNMACYPWLETWDVAIIYTEGTRVCVTLQWMSVDRMTLSPAKLNLIWTTWPLSTHVWWLGNPKHKAEVLPVCIRCTTLLPKQADILLCIKDNNIYNFMNFSSPIYSTLLQNKFVNLVVVFVHLRFWSLSRP